MFGSARDSLFYVVDGSKGRGRGGEWRPALENVGAKGGIHGEPGGDRKLAFFCGGGGDETNGDGRVIRGVISVAQDVIDVMFFPSLDMRVRGVGNGGDGTGGREKGEVGLGVRDVRAVES